LISITIPLSGLTGVLIHHYHFLMDLWDLASTRRVVNISIGTFVSSLQCEVGEKAVKDAFHAYRA